MPDNGAAESRLKAGVVVVGGGIAGITTAVEASEAGLDVVLVEREATLGGRVARLNHYFPKMCPPSCGLEINFRRLRDNEKVEIYTLSEVEKIEGSEGNYTVTIKVNPRYVKPWAGDYTEWAKTCPVEVEDDFNYGLCKRKGLYFPFENAYPSQWIIDASVVNDPKFQEWVKECPDNGIDLTEQSRTVVVECASIAWATGWKPYDASKIDLLNYGKHPDIVTNVQMERLCSHAGPTGGKLVKLSDGGEVKSVAFLQCTGSRDENHLPFCSGVCCTASLKQASYVLDQYPDADVHMFYIDVRTPGRLEDFYQERQAIEKIQLHRGKGIKVDPVDGGLEVTAENTLTGELKKYTVDLVVLATGMEPATRTEKPPIDAELDELGFMVQNDDASGIYGVGTTVRPLGVAETLQDATGAAIKALHMARRS